MDLFRKLFTLLILVFSFIPVIYSENIENTEILSYINFRIDENSNTNKVYYEINYFSNIDVDNFVLEIYYNEILSDTCKKSISSDSSIISEKIMCEVEKLGSGEYKFIAKVLNENQVVQSVTNFEQFVEKTKYEFSEINSSIEFSDLGDKTLIIIDLNMEGENLKVYNTIPKEVIAFLSDENKDSLIKSNYDYEIIESDPLIAWSVDKAPTKINYTINKKVSLDNQKKFSIDIQEESTFNKFKWIIYILITIIIILAVRPAFKKN